MEECKALAVCEEKFKNIEKRLEIIDKLVDKIQNLSISVESLAQSSKNIVEENIRQNKKIELLEAFNFNKYKGIVKTIATAIIGAVVAYIYAKNN